nr:unnamed protein product [Digitaria exilis]
MRASAVTGLSLPQPSPHGAPRGGGGSICQRGAAPPLQPLRLSCTHAHELQRAVPRCSATTPAPASSTVADGFAGEERDHENTEERKEQE